MRQKSARLRRRILHGVLPALVLFGACKSGERQNAQQFTVSDSASIQIAHNGGSPLQSVPQWTVSDTPLLSIGEDGRDSANLLFGIRSPHRRADGTIALGNGGSPDLRFYDQGGKFVRSIGRRGDGPGEFQGMYGLFHCAGDTMVVRERRRLSFWDGDGRFVRTVVTNFGNSGWAQSVEAVSHDCSKVLVAENNPTMGSDTRTRAEHRLFWWNLRGSVALDTLMRYHGTESIALNYLGNQVRANIPWSPAPVVARSSSGVVFGGGSHAEFRLIGDKGITTLVRWDAKAREVTADDRASFESKIAKLKALYPDQASSYPPLNLLSPNNTMPLFSAAIAEDTGNVWLREYGEFEGGYVNTFAPESKKMDTRWLVFDNSGRMLATVQLPANLEVKQIRADEVIGVWRDEDDSESVRIYQLQRKPK